MAAKLKVTRTWRTDAITDVAGRTGMRM